MKKLWSILFCLCLGAGLVLSGCGSDPAKDSDESQEETAQNNTEDKTEEDAADDGSKDQGTTGLSEASDDEEADEEEETKDDETSRGVTELTDFTGGVLLDEEDGDRFEILSMGPDEIGYKVEYAMNTSGSSGSDFLWMHYCIVDGIICESVRDSVQDDENYGETRYFYIEQEWLDALGITDVHSIHLKFDIGKVNSYSSFTATAEAEVMLYPNEKNDTLYEPVLSDVSRTLYEDENVRIILMNGVTRYYEGNLIRQNFGVLYLKKSDAAMSYNISKMNFGELYAYVESTDPNAYGYDTTEPGAGVYINEVWNVGSDREAWNAADLAHAEMILFIHDGETYEESEMSVTVDMTLPEERN